MFHITLATLTLLLGDEIHEETRHCSSSFQTARFLPKTLNDCLQGPSLAASASFLAQPCPKAIEGARIAARRSLSRHEPSRGDWPGWPDLELPRSELAEIGRDRPDSASLAFFPSPPRYRRKWSRSIFRRTRPTRRVLTPLSTDAGASSRIFRDISKTPSSVSFRRRTAHASRFRWTVARLLNNWTDVCGSIRSLVGDSDENMLFTHVLFREFCSFTKSGDDDGQVWRGFRGSYETFSAAGIHQWDRDSVE